MAARPKIVRIARRFGGAAGSPATLANGLLAFNDNGGTLDVGGPGNAVHHIVGADLQIYRTGIQTIETGAANLKTFDVTNFNIAGGSTGNMLTKTAGGGVQWSSAPSGGLLAVDVDDPLDGTGVSGDPLTITPATTAQIVTGTDDVFPVTALGLRSQIGGPLTDLTTTVQTGIIQAINSLVSQITALAAPLRVVGSYNVATNTITPSANSPATAGALPAVAAGNEGWILLVTTGGTGTGNAAGLGAISVGDWVVSTGTAWTLFDLDLSTVAAGNVSVTAISGMTATTVQAALAELHTAVGGALTEVVVDDLSIQGAGTTTDPFEVGDIDCGTF